MEAYTQDARLDEVRYFDLSERMHAQFGIPHPRVVMEISSITCL